MPKIGKTHRRPNPWSRRSESDGSCLPELKKVRFNRFVPFRFWGGLVALSLGVAFLFASALLTLYYWIIQHSLGGIFRIPITLDSIMYATVSVLSFKGVVYLWMLIYIVITNRCLLRVKKQAIAHRCLLCPRCGYDLRSRTDDAEPCPECGQQISRRECVRLWARTMRPRRICSFFRRTSPRPAP